MSPVPGPSRLALATRTLVLATLIVHAAWVYLMGRAVRRGQLRRDEAWLDPNKLPNAKKMGTAEPLDTGTAAELDTGTPLDTGTAASSSSAAGADTTEKRRLVCHYKHIWSHIQAGRAA